MLNAFSMHPAAQTIYHKDDTWNLSHSNGSWRVTLDLPSMKMNSGTAYSDIFLCQYD